VEMYRKTMGLNQETMRNTWCALKNLVGNLIYGTDHNKIYEKKQNRLAHRKLGLSSSRL